MLVLVLLLAPGLLASSGPSFAAPPTTTPRDTISNCAAWGVAQPWDDRVSLAKRYEVELDRFITYNPSLKYNFALKHSVSYCVEAGVDNSYAVESKRDLSPRADAKPENMGDVIKYMFLVASTPPLKSVVQRWDTKVGTLFNSLSYADFSDWLRKSPEGQDLQLRMDAGRLGYYLACRLRDINDMVAKWLKSETLVCICYGSDCCKSDESCLNPRFKRLSRSVRLGGPERRRLTESGQHDSKLVPRAPLSWSASRNGITYTGSYNPIAWPGPTDFDETSWIWQHVFAMSLNNDCNQLAITEHTYNEIKAWVSPQNLGYDEWDFAQVEHWVEKNMIGKFTAAVISQQLPSGRAFTAAANIPPTFFTTFMDTQQAALLTTKTVSGAESVSKPNVRIMHTLGSKRYSGNFLLMEAGLNNMKEGILKGDNPVADSTIQNTMTNVPRLFLTHLRNVFGVIGYLNDALALEKGETTLRAIRWEWYQYQQLYASFINGQVIDVVAAWDEWYLDFMNTRIKAAKNWLMVWSLDCKSHWDGHSHMLAPFMVSTCELYYKRASQISGYNDLSYPTGTPTPPP